MQRIRQNKKGVSNIIVVALGLVIVVTIVVNVFLWNYEMNQLDWEKMREDIKITDVAHVNVTRSFWFVAQSEYIVNTGNHMSGTYEDTKVANDGNWETFQEGTGPPSYRLDINGTFILDVSAYPLESISTVEIQLRYRASDGFEKWFLKAYNWTAQAYRDNGFNLTAGHTPTGGWDNYAINLTDKWRSYVRGDGTIYIKFHDEGNDAVRTTIDIDFLGVRTVASGTRFTFKNKGSLTSHLVSLWVNNSTHHRRYGVSIFVNTGDTESYIRSDISLPNKPYTVKVVTERGNIAIHSES